MSEIKDTLKFKLFVAIFLIVLKHVNPKGIHPLAIYKGPKSYEMCG